MSAIFTGTTCRYYSSINFLYWNTMDNMKCILSKSALELGVWKSKYLTCSESFQFWFSCKIHTIVINFAKEKGITPKSSFRSVMDEMAISGFVCIRDEAFYSKPRGIIIRMVPILNLESIKTTAPETDYSSV